VAPAWGQRVIFPSVIPQESPYYTSQNTAYGGAALDGTIQPSAPAFDPYAGPGAAAPAAAPAPAYDGAQIVPPGGFFPTAIRLLQEVRMQDTWIPRQIGNNGFGINDTDLNASFAFPVGQNQAPILLTPGFNFHFLDGPTSVPGTVRDLPARVYDAYLGLSWRPQFTPRIGADVAVSAGAYTDFQRVNWDSVRVLSRGLGIFTVSPQLKVVAGVVYIDRLRVKLLPAGGIIWTPNPDVKFDIVFPYPKLAQRLTTVGTTDIWGYIAGEYGGGQWSVVQSNGQENVINYNDIRAIMGVEWFGQRTRGNLELGYVFDREILYRGAPTFDPGNSMMFRGGISF
jgi:uncharacterized protein DUF6268